MTRPLLPPRGLFVKTEMVFNLDIPSPMLVTWLRLRALAWGQNETPALSLAQLADIIGISSSSIYGHMTALKVRNALRWRSLGDGTIIVSFLDGEDGGGEADSKLLESPVNIKDLDFELDLSIDSSSQKTFTTSDAVSLYRKVTGHFTFPPGQYMAPRIEIILGLLHKHGEDGARQRMAAAWDDWRTKRRKDSGVPYSEINTAWIDYTMAEPNDAPPQTRNADGSMYV